MKTERFTKPGEEEVVVVVVWWWRSSVVLSFSSLREPQRGEMKEENESSVSTFCCFCSLFCSVLFLFLFFFGWPSSEVTMSKYILPPASWECILLFNVDTFADLDLMVDPDCMQGACLLFLECKWPFIMYHYSAHLLGYLSHPIHPADRRNLALWCGVEMAC
jgi:hypothetical protein